MKNEYSLRTVRIEQLIKHDEIVAIQLFLNNHDSVLDHSKLNQELEYQFELPICYEDRTGKFIVIANFLYFLNLATKLHKHDEIQVLVLRRKPPHIDTLQLQYLLYLLVLNRSSKSTSGFFIEVMRRASPIYPMFFGHQFKLNRRRLESISHESEDILRKRLKGRKHA